MSISTTFLKAALPAALALSGLTAHAQTQAWAPYFGNTHFGFSTAGDTLAGNSSPAAAKLADLDGDGDLDAVVAQSISGTGFDVLINTGAGYFSLPTHYATTDAAEDVVIGDFTGDGAADVVVANTGQYGFGQTVALFPGLGNGRFGTATAFAAGAGPSGLAAADFNADGQLDLAVANFGYSGQDSTVSILLSTGASGFAPALTIPVGTGIYKLAVGRMDTDSLPDLVAVADQQRVFVLHNMGQGAFLPIAYQLAGPTWAGDLWPAVALADMDADQDLDVVYSSSRTWNGSQGQAIIWHNTGAGVLGSTQTLVPFENYSSGTGSLVVADLNHDNLPDLVSASTSGRTGDGYRVMLNQGSGIFGPAVVRSAGQNTKAVLVGDVTNDSHQDVLTLDSYSRELTVHRNLGTGQFPEQTLFTAGVPWLAGTIEAADLDNDGDLDIVTSSNSRAAVAVAVAVLLNNGNGTFAAGVQIATAGVQAKCRDFNNDGLVDLLYVGGTGSTGYNFYTALNTGNGTFATPVLWNVGACAPEDIDAADMDGDGDLDVVATSGCSSEVAVCYNQGTASATFGQAVTTATSSWAGPLALGDFNEDGRLDVAAGLANDVAILLSDSTGLTAPAAVAMDAAPFDILAADVNDDGHLDIASCNYGSNPGDYSMALRLGNGDGTFQPAVVLPAAYSPDLANVSGIACGDIDNDQDLDLMVANNATNDMSVYLNQGGGHFSAALRTGLSYGARSPWFADFNGDGHCEVAALVDLPPSGFQSALVVLQGAASGLRTAGTGAVVLATPATAAAGLRLSAAPNPFGQATTLSFAVPQAGPATVTVYNVLGQVVARPFSGPLAAGTHSVAFPKGNLPAGTYHVRLVSAAAARSTTVVVID